METAEIENNKKAAFCQTRRRLLFKEKNTEIFGKIRLPCRVCHPACRFARPTCFPSDVLRKFLLSKLFQKFRKIFLNFRFHRHN
jgi:hypothetical protein